MISAADAGFDHEPTDEKDTAYVDTPKGIFSEAGIWFHVREDSLRTYAGEVLAHESIESLLDQAAVWLRSSQAIAIWGLLGFLAVVPPIAAVAATLGLYLFWEIVGPSATNRILLPIFRVLERPFVQMAGYVLILSWLARGDEFAAVGAGLAGFVLLRWNLVRRALDPIVERLRRPLYVMPIPDHVLRLLVVRAAVKYDVPLPDVEAIRREVLDRLREDR